MQAVLDYLARNQSRFVDELCDYLRIPSISAQPNHKRDMEAAANWLAKHCREIGLKPEICRTDGHPIVLARTPRKKGSRKPHYLVYGHYDVQPPDPLDKWTSPPFEPRIANGNVYARGSTDNKGQHFAHLKTIEAYLKTGTELPCDVTFVVEGEEEMGSDNIVPFLRKRKSDLKSEGVVVSDTGMPSPRHPALTYALRGVLAVEVRIDGPNRDLHSGLFGGAVENPAMALSQMLAKCRDARGRVAISGFYDDVVKLTPLERREMKRMPGTDAELCRLLGVKQLYGESGYTMHEQRSARPTCEINGLTSGYQGAGSKTIVPSYASAKLTFRLVPNQTPEKIVKLVRAYLKKICPPTVRMTFEPGHAGAPYIVQPTSRQVGAALNALRSGFGHPPILLREGGSIPIVNDFKKILGVDTLLLGLALPDDNLHSPNEKFSLDQFRKGMMMAAHLWQELGRL